MVPYHLTDNDLENLITRTGVAIGAVDNDMQHPDVDVAFGDDTQAGYEAIRWLIEQRGHKRIGMIRAKPRVSCNCPPLRCLSASHGGCRAGVPPDMSSDGNWSVESGQNAIRWRS